MIEPVNGIPIIVTNAGKASVISDQSILAILSIINDPIIINAGDVIAGTEAKLLANGNKKIEITTKKLVVNAVSPVRPPFATPAEDSIYAEVGVLPNNDPASDANESANNASFTFSIFPFFTKPACVVTATIVPVVSNSVTIKNVKTIPYNPNCNALILSLTGLYNKLKSI